MLSHCAVTIDEGAKMHPQRVTSMHSSCAASLALGVVLERSCMIHAER